MLQKNRESARFFAKAGTIGALYFVLTIVFLPISYGPIQIRISECLAVLPLFYGEAVIGLTIGCLIANILGNGVLDIVFGTFATLVSCLLTYIVGKKIKGVIKPVLGFIPPIIINAVIVPFTFLTVFEIKELYFISAIQILIGQTISVIGIGSIVYFAINKIKKGLKRP